jgi:DNA-binding transcriptional regulator LsrR (DeoR family)
MVDSAHFNRRVDVEVVQLAGELSIDSRFSGHDLVRNLAEKLGGRYRYFNAPATTQDEATAAALMKTEQVANALALGRTSDVAVLGVGQYGMDSSNLFLQRAGASDDEIREAVELGAVGQISGRFYDREGKQLDLAINRRIISVDLDDLREIETVVAVASGSNKAGAVAAAIRGGLINVLIVDSSLGQSLEAV